MIRRVLFFGAACAAGGMAGAQTLPEGAARCAARLEQAAGADAAQAPLLGDVCPEYAEAIAASPWGDALVGEPAALDAEALRALADLARFYARDSVLGPSPDAEALDAVVAELAPFEPVPELSLWERALGWLAAWLDERTGETGERFLEWLRGVAIPDAWLRASIYALAATIAVLVAFLVANEVRRAGLVGRGRRAAPADAHGERHHARAAGPRLEHLRDLPLGKQPAALLAMIIERLRAREPRAARPSLTHRELAAAGASLSRAQAAALGTVAGAAERAAFGAWTPRADELEPVLAEGRALLEQLGQAPGNAP